MAGDHLKTLILFGALLLSTPLSAAQLNLELGENGRTWQTEELLKHPQAQTITIPNDVSYKRDMRYRAVPLSALLTGVKPDDHLQAVALDGFAAELSAAPLLNTQGARAWLAIEDPTKPWPPPCPLRRIAAWTAAAEKVKLLTRIPASEKSPR